jgi:hypothetical protein
LNEAALWAVGRLLDRAQAHGASNPEHYLFPAFRYRHTKTGCAGHDPTKPYEDMADGLEIIEESGGTTDLALS